MCNQHEHKQAPAKIFGQGTLISCGAVQACWELRLHIPSVGWHKNYQYFTSLGLRKQIFQFHNYVLKQDQDSDHLRA